MIGGWAVGRVHGVAVGLRVGVSVGVVGPGVHIAHVGAGVGVSVAFASAVAVGVPMPGTVGVLIKGVAAAYGGKNPYG